MRLKKIESAKFTYNGAGQKPKLVIFAGGLGSSGVENESHLSRSREEAVRMADEMELDVDSVIKRLLSGKMTT